MAAVRDDRDFPFLESLDYDRKVLGIESETQHRSFAIRNRTGPVLCTFMPKGKERLLDSATPNQIVFYDENAHPPHFTR